MDADTQSPANHRSDSSLSPVELLRGEGSKELYVFFGGIAAGIAIPPFEFFSAAKILDTHKLFIRDLNQSWYQCGVPDVGRDIHSIAQFIRDTQTRLGAESLTLVGNSMGGFAALLFGSMIPGTRVVAFSPQSFICPLRRLVHRDSRWPRAILKTYRRSALRSHVWDLVSHFTRVGPPQSASVYAASGHPLDRLHAERLARFPNITVTLLNQAGHNVVRQLRDSSRLAAAIQGTL